MKIQDIERFTIPIAGSFEGSPVANPEGTTVEELIKALKRLPPKGIVSRSFTGGDIVVMHYKPDIDSDGPDPFLQQFLDSLKAPIYASPYL